MKYNVKVCFYVWLFRKFFLKFFSLTQIGIIGGSGLDDPDFFKDATEEKVSTPYGDPSDSLLSGKINGINCVLLARSLSLFICLRNM